MTEPKLLLFPNDEGDLYTVATSYDALKSTIELENGSQTWHEMLRLWYRELLFNYRFESSLESLQEMGFVERIKDPIYSLDDLHNSLIFIRTKVIRELGNGAISNINEEVERMWKRMEEKVKESNSEN